jgi:hypothetical protein
MCKNLIENEEQIISVAVKLQDELIRSHQKRKGSYDRKIGTFVFIKVHGTKEELFFLISGKPENITTSVIKKSVFAKFIGNNPLSDIFNCLTLETKDGTKIEAGVKGLHTEEENTFMAMVIISCLRGVSIIDVFHWFRLCKVQLPKCFMHSNHYINEIMIAEPWLHITMPRKK